MLLNQPAIPVLLDLSSGWRMLSSEPAKWTAALLFPIPHNNRMILQDECQRSIFNMCKYLYKQQYGLCSSDLALEEWSPSLKPPFCEFWERQVRIRWTELCDEWCGAPGAVGNFPAPGRRSPATLQHQSALPAPAAMPWTKKIQLIFNQITLLREKEGDREKIKRVLLRPWQNKTYI